MTLRQLLIRFTLTYIAALIVLGFVVSWLNLKASTSINSSALLAAALYACMTFCEKNGRRLSADEVTKAWVGMLAIDLCLQVLIVLIALGSLAPGLLSGPMLFALVFVGLLHAVGLYAMVRYSAWLYDKQQQGKARKAARQARKRSEARASRGHIEQAAGATAVRPQPTMEYQRTVPMELR